MIVYLLRHGVAADLDPAQVDAQRALTEEGAGRLERASRGWRRLVGEVELVLASPLLRARQTAAIFVRRVAKGAATTETAALAPDAAPGGALGLLHAELLAGRRGVACVGHEPHLGSLLGLLLTGGDRAPIPLKKGMLVAVELESPATMLGRLSFALGQRQAGDVG